MGTFLQPSMSGGELAPGLQGRVDTARYQISLKTCRNVITKPTGGVIKRPGTIFRGTVKDSSKKVRLVPFIYSTEIKYLIEMGHNYLRFWVGGALLRDGSNNIVEVATPYDQTMIGDVRFTQSADVLYLVHPTVRPKELRRTAADAFTLVDFNYRRGPFRGFNTDEALLMAVSGVEGSVTVTTNASAFNADMIGSLIYVEEKELRSVKPWVAGERNPPLGALRRSDSKVYRCVAVPSLAGLTGTPYYLAGSVRPTHETGRAFDGPQDVKDDTVNEYVVGVEWEYVHGGFGILQVTGYTSPTQVTALVIERVPDSIVGTAPSPGNTWVLNGDGVTKQFTITGAVSNSYLDYQVTIGGSPTQSNPNYPGGGGVGNTGGGTRPGGGGNIIQDIP